MPAIVDAIRTRQRFVLTSHARPDGDSIGSQLAMAYALGRSARTSRSSTRDPAPGAAAWRSPACRADRDRRSRRRARSTPRSSWSAATSSAPASTGLDTSFVINIDHHPGNTGYGAINWFDESAAACGEMVFDLVDALGVPLTPEIATHIYLAILTDTGSFHYSSITPRTFDICRAAASRPASTRRAWRAPCTTATAGPAEAVRRGAERDAARRTTGRIALIYLDRRDGARGRRHLRRHRGADQPAADGEGDPGVVFFKESSADDYRVSMRSKGAIDVGAVAKEFGGGGHKNAAGCTVAGDYRRREPRCSKPSRRHGRRPRVEAEARRPHDRRQPLPARLTASSSSTSRRPDLARRRRLARRAPSASRASATPARSIRWRPACCRCSSAARRASRSSSVSDEKRYEAVVRFGHRDDTYDAEGTPIGPRSARALPTRGALDAALDAFRGTSMQTPAGFSAKKVDGDRAYDLRARARSAVALAPVPVTRARRWRSLEFDGRRRDAARDLLGRLLRAVAGPRPRRGAGRGAHLHGAAADAERRCSASSGPSPSDRARQEAGRAPSRRRSCLPPTCWRTCRQSWPRAKAASDLDMGARSSRCTSTGRLPGRPATVRLLDQSGRLVGDRESRAPGFCIPSWF